MFKGPRTGPVEVQNVKEFKRVQEALRSSEAEFKTLVETMPQIVWVTRPDGWHIDFNQHWLDYTGLTLEESLGFGWNPPFHPDDRGHAAEKWQRATSSGEPYEIEYRLRRWDGVYHWMLGRALPMRDAEGRIVKWFGTCTDIDHLKRTQERLDEAQLVGKIGDWEYNPDTEKTTWSAVLYRIFGRDPELGPPGSLNETARLYEPESAAVLENMLRLGASSGQTLTFDLRTRSVEGRESYVQIVAVPRKDGNGRVVSLFGTLQDISDRKYAEMAMQARAQQQLLTATLGRFALSAESFDEVYTEAASAIAQGLNVDFSDELPLDANADMMGRFSSDDVGFLQGIANILSAAAERQRANELLSHMALHDSLTDLPNRLLLTERLNIALSYARRHGQQVALLFLDLDRFKHVNDVFGHTLGDEVLREVAKRLSFCVRGEDTVSRQGGDEFIVALPEIRDEQDAAVIANKLLKVITSPLRIEGIEINLGMSIGIACFPASGDDAGTLLRNADTAMYVAKESGRNRYQFYSPEMNMRSLDRLTLESDLRCAIERDELYLMYQPQFCLNNGNVLGLEALVRWRHPSRGLIVPGQFIPVAEDCGLIIPIGNWVLESACTQHADWVARGLTEEVIAVNISAHQFRQADFCERISEVLCATGLRPELLELEVTEGVVMQGIEKVLHKLNSLRELGVNLAIDDFGTGYSSLNYLKQFPLHRLKIDQSFVRGLPIDQESGAIVKAIIQMGHSLGLDVLAEGIETTEEQKHLQTLGCDAGQGFLYSRPLSAEDCEEYFRVTARN